MTRSFLLVADDSYIKGLIATINSIIQYFPDNKIYLVHNLTEKNLKHVERYVYKHQVFDNSEWQHIPSKHGYIDKISFGRFQTDFIEEEEFLYLDVDIIINKPFIWESPKTMSLDIKKQPMNDEIKEVDKIEQLRRSIIADGGHTEFQGDFMLYTTSAYFVNNRWFREILKPKIIKISREYVKRNVPSRWYDMDYFHAAICMLGHPVERWNIHCAWIGLPFNKDKYPQFFLYEQLDDCELIHYVGEYKPWNFDISAYPYEGSQLWWECYNRGPIKKIEEEQKCKT